MTTTTSPTERVGRYQLLEPIGIGPSGTVSRAKVFGVAGFERQFAVKRFHAELTATAAMAAMLSAAARAYGSLEHPRIARMSEFGVAQGTTFTAVEYVPGLDALRLIGEARLAGAALAAGGALALVSQAARAVGYAHGRGLTHLGLAPTNVIVTADGDIKITDFGILSATLPPRPIEVPRLAQRIPYLAPEQLANEATSAATDVFALGVLAYELVTGTRTFKGDTPQQVASSIMAGPPAEPPLPRPIVRVLQRCLARSPFERFPDARALADALDAALRVAPVPGTRKDIGAQVKDTLDRLAALNEGQMSGMVALYLGTGPIRRLDDDVRGASPTGDAGPASAPYELGPADPPGGPGSLGGAGITLSDLPRPMTTVPGLAPPPIPVPPGLGPPSIPPPPGLGSGTLLGMGKTPPPAIPARPRPGSVSGIPPVPPTAAHRAQSRPGIDLSLPLEPPPEPGALAAPAVTTESAVHPLDPSDLMAIDALPDEADARVGADEPADPPPADEPPPPDDAPADEPPPREPGARDPSTLTPSSADDFQDAPTHALSRSAAAAAAGRPRPTSYPLDPSSIDTRPIPPITLEPVLFDPIARSDRETGAPERTSALDEDQWFDDPAISRAPTVPSSDEQAQAPGSGRVPRPTPSGAPSSGKISSPMAIPGSSRMAVPTPLGQTPGGSRMAVPPGLGPIPGGSRAPTGSEGSAEPKLGQTMLGYAASPLPSRATPSSPFPPATTLPPEDRADDELPVPSLPPEHRPEPVDDPLSEMMLEGFRTGPASAPEDAVSWPQEPGDGPGDEQPPESLPALPEELAAPPPGWITAPPPHAPAPPMPPPGEPPRRRPLWIFVGMIGAAAVAISAWQVYEHVIVPPSSRGSAVAIAPSKLPAVDAAPPAAAPDAAQIAAAPRDAAERAAPADAGHAVAAAPADAARIVAAALADAAPAPRDAGGAPGDAAHVVVAPPGPPPGPPAGPGDSLTITSTPPGARVFLDGADTGVTPLKTSGTPDRHTIALLLAGHELYVAQVDGHGAFQIPLKEVTPTNGPAGIKVLRCKDKERYYVFVDGKPTGETCPSERIGCELGPHTVEVYDVVSETRRKWDIVVKETRLSFRVRVE